MPKGTKTISYNNIGFQLKCSVCEITYKYCNEKKMEFTKKLMDKHMKFTHGHVNNKPIISENHIIKENGSITVKQIKE